MDDLKKVTLTPRIVPFLWHICWLMPVLFLGMTVLFALEAALTMLLTYSIKEMVDSPLRASAEGVAWYKSMAPAAWMFIGLSAGVLASSRLGHLLNIYWGPTVRIRVIRALFSYLKNHSHNYFSSHFSGGLASRVNETTTGVVHFMNTLYRDIFPLVVTMAMSLFLFYKAHSSLALFLVIWFIVFGVVMFFLARPATGLSQRYTAQRSNVTGRIVDVLTNIQSVIFFARHHHEENNLTPALYEQRRRARELYLYIWWIQTAQAVATMILLVGVTVWSLIKLQTGEISAGDFAMLFSLSLLISNKMEYLGFVFLSISEYLGNIHEGLQTIIKPREITDKPGAKPLKVTKGEVKFDNIHFGYDKNKPVFDGLDLRIASGQSLGLVGASGSGKSTMVNLLLRLYDPQAGKVLIDGQPIHDVTLESLREQISIIPQDPQLFNRSLMENIRYGRADATDKEVIAAAKKAFCHGFITALKEGYDTKVGERGIKLSGGQRQRIAIARAILKNAPILVLDEATSSLDSTSEAYIQKSMTTLMKNKTVLIIAHRLSTLKNMDRIVVLKEGKIVEDGQHASLKKKKDGHYAKLWAMQVGGFIAHDNQP